MPVSASGENAAALLHGEPDFVVPVDVVGDEGHQARLAGGGGVEILAQAALEIVHAAGLGQERLASRLSPLGIG
jgi:hypothetical protein